jgi:bacillolysin
MQLTPLRAYASVDSTPAGPSMYGPALPTGADAPDTVVDPASLRGRPDPDAPGIRPGRQAPELLGAAVDTALAADSGARIGVDRRANVATFLSGEFGVVMRPGIGGSGPDRIARTFLARHGTLFGIADHNSQLKLLGIEQDRLGMRHFRYQQLHQGLPVFGQQLVVHATDDRITSVGGRTTPNIGTAEPRIAGAEAARRALDVTRRGLVAEGGGAVELRSTGNQQLGWYTLEDGSPRLAYEVLVGGGEDQAWQMYVDAGTGEVLDKWSLVHSALNRETVNARTGKVRREGDGPTADQVMDVAHDNAKGVYDFFKTKYDRDSIDGKGMKLKSVVSYGNKYNNAFWNGSST